MQPSALELLSPLVFLNGLFVYAIFMYVVWLVVGHIWDDEKRFPRLAFQRVILPLFVTLGLWSVEYALGLHARLPDYVDFMLNTLVATGFFISGWFLLRIPPHQRLHWRLRPPAAPRPLIRALAATFGSHGSGLVFFALAVILLSLSVWLQERPGAVATQSGFSLWKTTPDGLQTLTASYGMLVFGFGLLRELTRERIEWVSIGCATGVIGYAVLQLFAAVPEESELWVWTYTLGIVFKVLLLFGIVAFSVVISEMDRATEELDSLVSVDALPIWFVDTIHGGIGGQLTAIRTDAEAALGHFDRLETPLPDENARYLSESLHAMVQATGQAQTQVREILRRSESALTENLCPHGLGWSLRQLGSQLSHRTYRQGIPIRTRVNVAESLPALPRRVENVLFRIAREALTNVERHSHAKTLLISLSAEEHAGRLRLIVEDDGDGLPSTWADSRPRYGLSAMARLARVIDSEFEVSTTPIFRGTRIVVAVGFNETVGPITFAPVDGGNQ